MLDPDQVRLLRLLTPAERTVVLVGDPADAGASDRLAATRAEATTARSPRGMVPKGLTNRRPRRFTASMFATPHILPATLRLLLSGGLLLRLARS